MFTTVKSLKGPTIPTYSGGVFDFLDPYNSDIRIEDIAHALSNLCRFTGHSREFYSVAQHSVLVARQVFKADPEYGLAGLLHDAAEAYVGDVSKPLKVLLTDYKAIERRVEQAVLARFQVETPLPPIIKEIDIRMLATERRDLFGYTPEWSFTYGMEPFADLKIEPWPPFEASHWFLETFRHFRRP